MTINLSKEMIKTIARIARGRLLDLEERERWAKGSIAVGEQQIARRHKQLKAIEKRKEEAKEVHALFMELLEQ